MRAADTTDADIVITEVGGTVGDIESLPFVEALRQMKREVGEENVAYIHTSLIPYLRAAGEMKTKPTQHSVAELRSLGIQPDMLVVRTEQPITPDMREKLALFTDVAPEAVIESLDVDILYEIALNMQKQGMDDVILKRLGLEAAPADMTEWRAMIDKIRNLKKTLNVALVGKYADLQDAYISVNEALRSGGYAVDAEVKINVINSEHVTEENVAELLADADGVMVPGGFGSRGTEGKIAAIHYARENNVPFLGVCLGMQLASVEFARNVLGYDKANSIELDPETNAPIIALMNDQKEVTDRGGTLRLGLYPAALKEGSLTKKLYNDEDVVEVRHRHRYEFNTDFRKEFEDAGMVFAGTSPDDRLMEIIELPSNDFFVAAQYHPEFMSRPNRPEPLYAGFIAAALKHKEG